MSFPSLPPDLLRLLPVQLTGIMLVLVIIVWLFNAIKGLISSISNWRKDELDSAAKLRTERDKELRDAIAAARDARQSEARWYGQYTEATEENRELRSVLRELGAAKDKLERDNAALGVRLRLYEAFMESENVSEESKVAWRIFKRMSDQARQRSEDRPEGSD